MDIGQNILSEKQQGSKGLKVMAAVQKKTEQFLVNELLDLDCKIYIAKSETDAIQKIRFHSFNIVIFQENCHLEAMQILQSFPMNIRRFMFTVFIGDLVETFNMLQSYVLSCNLVINSGDLSNFKEILQNAVDENKTFYRAYNYTLENHYQKR
ncbi:hypothetical protein [Candidatus Uabimicrobium sp. HlEnr_7]|uniref:hypothetical protein n=1 Tax=Candidatus Uabimicrobium helgolandensis TaxID=3095367 RepID=UPI003556863D